MYYIITWYGDRFLVYHTDTNLLGYTSSFTILGAIEAFSTDRWNITTQPLRFKFTDTELLEYNDTGTKLKRSHTIVHKLPSLDFSYLQQHYPELLI